jgi:hypothetical protein
MLFGSKVPSDNDSLSLFLLRSLGFGAVKSLKKYSET